MKQLFKILQNDIRGVCLAVFLGTLTVVSSVGLFATSAYLISKAALKPWAYTLTLTIVGVRFFGLSRAVFRYLERYFSHKTTFNFLAEIRKFFYEKIEPKAPAIFQKARSTDLLSRMVADVESLQNFFLRAVYPYLVILCVLILVGIFLWRFSFWFSLLLFSGFIIATIFLPALLGKKRLEFTQKLRTERAFLADGIGELILGYIDLKTNNSLEEKVLGVQKLSQKLIALRKMAANLTAFSESTVFFLSHFSGFLALVLAVYLSSQGKLSGVLIALVVLVVQTSFEAVLPAAAARQYWEESKESARRIFSILNEPPQVIEGAGRTDLPGDFSLEFKKVTLIYPGNVEPSLKEVSFFLKEGQKIAVVGPSGSGKSSILKLLLRFYDYEGEIFLGGEELKTFSPEAVRTLFGVVSQESFIFNATLEENLRIAKPEAKEEELLAVLEKVRLSHLKLSFEVGERGERLSGGERQRLLIARLLLKNAPIWLLDEPTTGLDSITEKEILDNIWEVAGDKTLVYITHRLRGLEKMDEILVMDRGEIKEKLSFVEFKERYLNHDGV
ncbi:thiol reductant ABC exporter subunit CydC [Carboxydothermus ferrireducens]|uniref:ATP-binding cassette subfamily C protein CydC n=1 Tax=Carboxydothermus ferrireducens DSM 11255 TaxID=1119529 RepID=A0ABX2R9H6_9THEO|nr:thiol reductant ABC exporter subunit CydC [Carboxydothermus ferrireducens]NYE57829.1 ATP-binding cassette subfamily C protein CydC [Carboxydothermus ferrireducens DSM 11255]